MFVSHGIERVCSYVRVPTAQAPTPKPTHYGLEIENSYSVGEEEEIIIEIRTRIANK